MSLCCSWEIQQLWILASTYIFNSERERKLESEWSLYSLLLWPTFPIRFSEIGEWKWENWKACRTLGKQNRTAVSSTGKPVNGLLLLWLKLTVRIIFQSQLSVNETIHCKKTNFEVFLLLIIIFYIFFYFAMIRSVVQNCNYLFSAFSSSEYSNIKQPLTQQCSMNPPPFWMTSRARNSKYELRISKQKYAHFQP